MNKDISAVASIIRWTLLTEGPSNIKTIKNHLISHPELAYVSLREYCLDAKIMQAIQFLHLQKKYIYLPNQVGLWSLTQLGREVTLDLPLPLPQQTPWLQFGDGREYVYGLINPYYMYNLVTNGSSNFPIKIGRTNRSIDKRIQELQTGSFLDLRLGFQIATNDSQSLEKFIHRELIESRIKTSYGKKEWFDTNLIGINTIYKKYLCTQSELVA